MSVVVVLWLILIVLKIVGVINSGWLILILWPLVLVIAGLTLMAIFAFGTLILNR